MKKVLACLLLSCALAQVPLPALCDGDLPKASVALKDLKAVKLKIAISRDVHKGLHLVGEKAGTIEKELAALATKRLSELGLTVEPVPCDFKCEGDDSELWLVVDMDMLTSTYYEALKLQELVSLQRAPGTKVFLTTWQRAQHPRGNEGQALIESASDLIARFEEEYLQANPKR